MNDRNRYQRRGCYWVEQEYFDFGTSVFLKIEPCWNDPCIIKDQGGSMFNLLLKLLKHPFR